MTFSPRAVRVFGWWVAPIALIAASCGEDSHSDVAPTPSPSDLAGARDAGSNATADVLSIEPRILEVGALAPRATLDVRTTLRNDSARVVYVQNIRTSCHCLTLRAEHSRVEPGAAVALLGTLEGEKGIVRVRYTVATTCREQPSVTGWIHLTADPALRAQPAELDFGEVRVGSEAERELVLITDALPDQLPFVLAPTREGELPVRCEVGPAEAFADEDGRFLRYRARVFLDTELPVGAADAALIFEGTGYETIRVPVRAVVHDGWVLETPSVHFGKLRVGQSRDREVRVRCFDGDVVLTDVQHDVPGLLVEGHFDADTGRLLVRLTLTAQAVADLDATLSLAGTGLRQPIEVPLKAIVR